MDGHAWNWKDLTGQRFGRLVVLEEDDMSDNRTTIWRVRCDCGVEFSTLATSLLHGHTRSCGCLHSESVTARNHLRKGKKLGKRKPRQTV